jgi:hypothetical protein
MVLRRRGLARRAPPPISLVLATCAKAYIAALDATRFVGSPTSAEAVETLNRWIAFFAAACTRAVADAVSFEQRVEALVTEWRTRLGPVRADASALALLARIPEMPILTVRGAAIALDRTFAAANGAIEALVAAGILTPTKASRRNRVFEARELVDAFTALERQLASPDGNTRTVTTRACGADSAETETDGRAWLTSREQERRSCCRTGAAPDRDALGSPG